MSADNMSDLELTSIDPRKKNVVFILFSFISFVLKIYIYIFQIQNFEKKRERKKEKTSIDH
jgi:hypothetical protein